MSGQLLVADRRARRTSRTCASGSAFDDGGELRFVDQRTFGGLSLYPLVAGGRRRRGCRQPVAHIAPGPAGPGVRPGRRCSAVRRRRTGLKRALLDQTLGVRIGNIYADEALWRARLHCARPTEKLPGRRGRTAARRRAAR